VQLYSKQYTPPSVCWFNYRFLLAKVCCNKNEIFTWMGCFCAKPSAAAAAAAALKPPFEQLSQKPLLPAAWSTWIST
jgi:hypothetical protein